MSIRQRTWTDRRGNEKKAWIVDYTDACGKRHIETFAKKRDAVDRHAAVKVEVRRGIHLPETVTVTVEEACRTWIARCDVRGLEITTVENYQQIVRKHINPNLGNTKLTAITVPMLCRFEDKLRADGASNDMVNRVLKVLSGILAEAQQRGQVARNVVRDMRAGRGRDNHRQRRKKKLRVGVDIPTVEEIRALEGALKGRWRPLLLTAILTGLRASELRGLRWEDIDFGRKEIYVCRRADRHGVIGQPKSRAGSRSVPLMPRLARTLREWRLQCPRRKSATCDAAGDQIGVLELVFPNGQGNVEEHANIVQRGFHPAQIAAGVAVSTGEFDKHGKPILRAKYPGLHALRHFFASWCINRKEDGGRGLPPKVVQERLGHSTIMLTMDVYGHLFPSGDDTDEAAAAEDALLPKTAT